jgi:1,2-diacylglycerol 3-beta-glucosyltransferase
MLLKTALTILTAYGIAAGVGTLNPGFCVFFVLCTCIGFRFLKPVRIRLYDATGAKPFVTLIVPVKNEEDCIANCTAALRKMDYPSDKYAVLIVNDHSTDRTLEVLACENLPANFKIVNRKRKGGYVAGVLNDGLAALPQETEIIGIVDSDCIVSDNLLKEVAAVYADGFKGGCQFHEWHHNCNENLLTMVQHLLCIYENYNIHTSPDFKVGHFYHREAMTAYNEESIIEDFAMSDLFRQKKIPIRTHATPLIYRTFPTQLAQVYSQQYRYALGKQLINYKNAIIQTDVLLPLILLSAALFQSWTTLFTLLGISTIAIYNLLLQAWTNYYYLSYRGLWHNYPLELRDRIENQKTFTWLNRASAVVMCFYIFSIRLLPFFKIPLSLEVIKWNR